VVVLIVLPAIATSISGIAARLKPKQS
jgi:hypothetical protein